MDDIIYRILRDVSSLAKSSDIGEFDFDATLLPFSDNRSAKSRLGNGPEFYVVRIEMNSLVRRVADGMDLSVSHRVPSQSSLELRYVRHGDDKEDTRKREVRRGERLKAERERSERDRKAVDSEHDVFIQKNSPDKRNVNAPDQIKKIYFPKGVLLSLYSLRMLGVLESQRKAIFFSLLRMPIDHKDVPFLPQWLFLTRVPAVEPRSIFDFWLLDSSEILRDSLDDSSFNYVSPISYLRSSGKGYM